MVTTRFQRGISVVLVVAATLTGVSCGDVVRTGRAPVIVIVESVEAASGADPEAFSSFLLSDVLTRGGTINDAGRATFRITAKNPGPPTAPLTPSELNSVTLTRYRVVFRRADGRNTPGVDVPHPFDSAMSVTISAGADTIAGFELVRHQNKEEQPLRAMRFNGGAQIISTIAEITFYGRDLVGNSVSAQAFISVSFADFADPEN